jgi:hypothetical protein
MKLWVIGDSFTMRTEIFWADILRDNLNISSYINGDNSRDLQTILDIFFQNTYKIEKDDIVIIMIPDARWRVPILNEFYKDDKRGEKSYFKGVHSFEPEVHKIDEDLSNFYKLKKVNQFEIGDGPIYQFNILAQDTESVKENYIKILKSIKKTFPFRVVYLSWCDYLQDDIIWGRKYLTKEIGFWDTVSSYDSHWSLKMHQAIAKFLTEKLS